MKVYNKSTCICENYEQKTCPYCRGRGQVFGEDEKCFLCKGEGQVFVSSGGWTWPVNEQPENGQMY